jgi:hypothetical protein
MTLPIFVQKLLGGRPMLVCQPTFVDRVSGKTVYDCIDAYGRMWQANGPWSFFRCRKGDDWREECARREAEQAMVDTEGRSGGFYDLGRSF